MGPGPWDVEAANHAFLPHYMEEMAIIRGVQSGMDCSITKGFQAEVGTAWWGILTGPSHRWESHDSKDTSQP